MQKRRITAPSKSDYRGKKKRKATPELRPPATRDVLDIRELKAQRHYFRERNENAEPFPHLVIDPLCEPSALRSMIAEVGLFNFEFKESDLFKVFQSPDLSNLEETHSLDIPNLLKLREELYSAEFRGLISEIMGVGPLTDKIDCSMNIYAQSCHLLCHDDVIGTRSVAYILYLTDPDDHWEAADGGALELYDLDRTHSPPGAAAGGPQGVPMAVPSAAILPKFNSMALFRVQPGRSYHSVQEVYSKDKARLSISGWFHAAGVPDGADPDHLLKISSLGDGHRMKIPVQIKEIPKKQRSVLSEKEISELSAWIEDTYLTSSVLKQLQEAFESQDCIKLHSFLKNDIVSTIKSAIMCERSASFDSTNYSEGVLGGWAVRGPSHKCRYLKYSKEGDPGAFSTNEAMSRANYEGYIGAALNHILTELFLLPSFLKFISLICRRQLTALAPEVRRFRPGLDYSVAHMGLLSTEDHVDFNLCFVDVSVPAASSKSSLKGKMADSQKRGGNTAEEWESGDLGGFVGYVKADEAINPDSVVQTEADEVFQKHNCDNSESEGGSVDDNLTTLYPGFNVFSIALRRKNVMHFVKYLNSSAGRSSRWDISVESDVVQLEGS